MADFDDALVGTAAAFTDVFAEAVTYKPYGGTPRAIYAIVTRQQPGPIGDAPHGHSPFLKLDVENSAVTGISSGEVDCGKDLVSLPVRIGDAAQDRRITDILFQDAGRVVYEVR